MYDPNVPIDRQDVAEQDCPHLSDEWLMDGNGKWYCPICEGDDDEE